MRTFSAFRISLHTALFFSAASLTAVFSGCILLPFAVTLSILVFALIASYSDRPALRFSLMLVPALCLLTADGPIPAAVAAVPVVYALIVTGLGRFMMEIWEFRREFKLMLALMLPLIAATIFLGYTLKEEIRIPIVCARSSWIFIFSAFVFGVIAQRANRTGSVRSHRWQAGNIGFVLLPIAAAGALSFLVLYVIYPVFKYVGFGISSGLIMLIAGLSGAMTELFSSASKIHSENAPTMPPSIDQEQGPDLPLPEPTTEPPFNPSRFRRPDIDWAAVGIVLLILIVIAVIFILVRSARRRQSEYSLEGKREHGVDEADRLRSGRHRKRRERTQTNAEKLRNIYRQYLAFLHMYGIVPKKSETSADISENAASLIIETDEQLRALYRKARYASEEVTDEEVRLADELYTRLSSDENLRKK